MIALAVFALNLVALGLVAWHGGTIDRAAGAAIVLAAVVEPFVDHVTVGTWRVGVGALNLAQFLVLWALAERGGRWWLELIASLQLLIFATHLMPLLSPDHYTRTGVSLRLALWGLVSVLLFAAAWECWAARKFAREGHDHVQDVRGGV
ncbi:hypothetical protein [Brevundimonas sp.]|jgi:hypothetical protein|uniref:hypothetical protein n=1 Tax=Brevundimonas sp. TaxID=1871086 RepID=UPI002E0D732E|nr:hypothetical protein [Brevundimonas sp.]